MFLKTRDSTSNQFTFQPWDSSQEHGSVLPPGDGEGTASSTSNCGVLVCKACRFAWQGIRRHQQQVRKQISYVIRIGVNNNK